MGPTKITIENEKTREKDKNESYYIVSGSRFSPPRSVTLIFKIIIFLIIQNNTTKKYSYSDIRKKRR